MSKIIKLYGIKNCDSVKKAMKFLNNANVEFNFIDFRIDGLDAHTLEYFIAQTSLEQLINTRSTTYRNLPDKKNITLETILQHPTLIKRPVLVHNDTVLIGFKESEYHTII